jgi:hypothetical protein
MTIKTAIATTALGAALSASAKDLSWQHGQIVKADSVRTAYNPGAVIPIFTTHTDVVLDGDRYRFTAYSRHGCRLPEGDDVQYAVTHGTLHILDADGKECKLRVSHQSVLTQDLK